MTLLENSSNSKASRSLGLGWATFMARVTFYLLCALISFGLVAGVIIIPTFVERSDTSPEFSWSAFAYILTVLGLMVVVVLSLPGLLVGLWNLVRGKWRESWPLVTFFGPFSVVVGFEIVSHLVFLQCDLTPYVCEPYYDYDAGKISGTISGQWHLLHHSLVAALLLGLYWLVLRKWLPKILK